MDGHRNCIASRLLRRRITAFLSRGPAKRGANGACLSPASILLLRTAKAGLHSGSSGHRGSCCSFTSTQVSDSQATSGEPSSQSPNTPIRLIEECEPKQCLYSSTYVCTHSKSRHQVRSSRWWNQQTTGVGRVEFQPEHNLAEDYSLLHPCSR
jgi:hypothetical protein